MKFVCQFRIIWLRTRYLNCIQVWWRQLKYYWYISSECCCWKGNPYKTRAIKNISSFNDDSRAINRSCNHFNLNKTQSCKRRKNLEKKLHKKPRRSSFKFANFVNKKCICTYTIQHAFFFFIWRRQNHKFWLGAAYFPDSAPRALPHITQLNLWF